MDRYEVIRIVAILFWVGNVYNNYTKYSDNLNNGPMAEKWDLRTYANTEDPDQPAHPRSLVRIIVVRLHNIGIFLKDRTNCEDLDPTRSFAN